MRRVSDERDRMQREFNLEMERSRADKEFFRSEISFHKKTVAGLTAEKEIMMKQAKHDKEVLTQVIQDLENQLADTREERAIRKSEAGAAGPVVSGGQALPAVRGGNGRAKSERPGAEARSADLAAGLTEGGDSQSPDEVVGQLIRALMQTDAGRKMALEESVENAEERFAPLLEDFAFSDEERAHFLELAGAELGSEDMLWMELLMAKDEDRERIMQTWETDRERRLREMKAFLNDEEDWDRYRRYQARVPEYEQMDGLVIENARAIQDDGGAGRV